MSWRDPDSPWVRAMHKNRRVHEPLPVFFVFLALAGILALCIAIATCGAILRADLFVFIAMIGGACLLFFLGKGIARRNAMLENGPLINLVPQHDGQVCPNCREILSQPDKQCPHCETIYDLSLLKTFWQQFAFDVNTATQYLRQAADKSFKEIRPNAKFPVGPGRVRKKNDNLPGLYINGTAILVILVLKSLFPANLFVQVFVYQIPILAMGAGWPLMRKNSFRLNDSLKFCAQCEYQQTPDQDQPEKCPECGNAWLEDGHWVLGTKVESPWQFWVGLVLVAYGLIHLTTIMGPLINSI